MKDGNLARQMNYSKINLLNRPLITTRNEDFKINKIANRSIDFKSLCSITTQKQTSHETILIIVILRLKIEVPLNVSQNSAEHAICFLRIYK